MKAKNSWLRDEMPQLIFLILLVFAGRSSLADHYLVPSGSMEEALQVGDRVVVDKRVHGLRLPFTTGAVKHLCGNRSESDRSRDQG